MTKLCDLVNFAIETVSQDPFYREWFAHKDDLYNHGESAKLVDYSMLNDFKPGSMTGTKLSYLPFKFENKFYIVTKIRWYDWKQIPWGNNDKEMLVITEVSVKLFKEIKTQGKSFAHKLTTGQHNTFWNEGFKKRGETLT